MKLILMRCKTTTLEKHGMLVSSETRREQDTLRIYQTISATIIERFEGFQFFALELSSSMKCQNFHAFAHNAKQNSLYFCRRKNFSSTARAEKAAQRRRDENASRKSVFFLPLVEVPFRFSHFHK